MNCANNRSCIDFGPNPYILNVPQSTMENENFRTTVWTGCHLQMTLMCIPVQGDIGLEIHEDTDQVIRVEQGRAVVKMGTCRRQLEYQREVREGDTVFVPAGTWHNVINVGRCPLKVSSTYAPPNHPRGTIHRTKQDAQREEC